MLIDLINPDNLFSYNITMAHKFGINAALYISSLLKIYNKVAAKNKLIDNKYFAIDRNEIERLTTFDKKYQKEIEENLVGLKLIEKHAEKKYIYLNVELLVSIMKSEDEEFIDDIRSAVCVTKEQQKESKNAYILASIKNNINYNGCIDVRNAYEDWLDMVAEQHRMPSKALLKSAEEVVNEYAITPNGRDVEKALELLRFATIHNYLYMDRAKNDLMSGGRKYYKKDMSIQSSVHSSDENEVLDLTTEVFE